MKLNKQQRLAIKLIALARKTKNELVAQEALTKAWQLNNFDVSKKFFEDSLTWYKKNKNK